MRDKGYRLFGEYVKQYRMSGLVFLLFTGIFAAVFSLYELETEAVLYASGICAVVGIVLLGFHFLSFCRAHRERRRLLAGIEYTYGELPKPGKGTAGQSGLLYHVGTSD